MLVQADHLAPGVVVKWTRPAYICMLCTLMEEQAPRFSTG